MCVDPATALAVASGAVQMASSVVQYQGQVQDYNAKVSQYKQNVVNSWAAARDEQGQLLLRQAEEADASQQKIHLSHLEEAEKKAEANVAAASSGVSGISVENLISDISGRAAYNRTIESRNWKMTAAQLEKQQGATITRAMNRINSVQLPVAPNKAALYVKMAGAGVRTLDGIQKAQQ